MATLAGVTSKWPTVALPGSEGTDCPWSGVKVGRVAICLATTQLEVIAIDKAKVRIAWDDRKDFLKLLNGEILAYIFSSFG